jgi:hypothetical protein
MLWMNETLHACIHLKYLFNELHEGVSHNY